MALFRAKLINRKPSSIADQTAAELFSRGESFLKIRLSQYSLSSITGYRGMSISHWQKSLHRHRILASARYYIAESCRAPMEHPGKPKSRLAIDRQSRRPIERKCGLPLSGCDSHRPRAEARFGKTSRCLENSRMLFPSFSLPLSPPSDRVPRARGISHVSLPCVVRAFHEVYGTEVRASTEGKQMVEWAKRDI